MRIFGLEITRAKADSVVPLARGPMPVDFDAGAAEGQANPTRDPFSPGAPLAPWTQFGSPPIGWAPPVSYNKVYDPAKRIGVRHEILRSFADQVVALNVVRDAAKRQIRALKWDVTVRDPEVSEHPALDGVKDILRFPDRRTHFSDWISALLEDLFVIGTPCLGKLRDGNGRIIGLRVMDAATITPIVTTYGTPQQAPSFAYYGVHYGVPYRGYREDEIIYRPFNKRSWTPFGFGPVEQMLGWMLVALNRQIYWANWYSETSVPPAWIKTPESWDDGKIKFWQTYLDQLMSGNTAQKHKALLVPSAMDPVKGRDEPKFVYEEDEVLLRMACESFGVSPSWIAKNESLGKGAESVDELARTSGLLAYVNYIEETINWFIQNDLGVRDLEFGFVHEETNVKGKAEVEINDLHSGLRTINEIRTQRGDEAYDEERFPLASVPLIFTSVGAVPLQPEEPQPLPDGGEQEAVDDESEPAVEGGEAAPPVQKAEGDESSDTGVTQDRTGLAFEEYVLGDLESPDPDWRVSLVDGARYRRDVSIDFTEGTNPYAPTGVGFVPPGVVAIDSAVPDAERAFVVAHEIREAGLMALGRSYDDAHQEANRTELEMRRAAVEEKAKAAGGVRAEVARWRRVVAKAAKAERAPRPFASEVIPAGTRAWVERGLAAGESVKAFRAPSRRRAPRWSTSERARLAVDRGESLWHQILRKAADHYVEQAAAVLEKETEK